MTATSKTASLLSVVVLASSMLASAAIAAPFSAGNSFEIPVVTHSGAMGTTTPHRVVRPRLPAGNSVQLPVDSINGQLETGKVTPRPMSAGNSFDIPVTK